MNINFHYFTVKALARSAGFTETSAQCIAEYSQLVDDYSLKGSILADWAPEEAVERKIAQPEGKAYKVNLIATGFSLLDNIALVLNPGLRIHLLIPFHFVPISMLTKENLYDVVVPTFLDSPNLIAQMLHEAGEDFAHTPECRDALIRIGLLLHIFADTHAHCNFSGERTNDANDYKVKTALRAYANGNIQDETSHYRGPMHVYEILPAVGHATVGVAPDDTYIEFTFTHQKNAKPDFTRNNRPAFLAAAREIYAFLCKISGKITPPFCEISKQIEQGFFIDNHDQAAMTKAWHQIFPDIDFTYNKDSILKRMFNAKAPGLALELRQIESPKLDAIKNARALALPQANEERPDADKIYHPSEELYAYTIIASKVLERVVGPEVARMADSELAAHFALVCGE